MNDASKFNSVVSFLWAIADLLNGAFKKSEFQKIILPFTVLRRLDYALDATKAKITLALKTTTTSLREMFMLVRPPCPMMASFYLHVGYRQLSE